jgi:hypothetical protein
MDLGKARPTVEQEVNVEASGHRSIELQGLLGRLATDRANALSFAVLAAIQNGKPPSLSDTPIRQIKVTLYPLLQRASSWGLSSIAWVLRALARSRFNSAVTVSSPRFSGQLPARFDNQRGRLRKMKEGSLRVL